MDCMHIIQMPSFLKAGRKVAVLLVVGKKVRFSVGVGLRVSLHIRLMSWRFMSQNFLQRRKVWKKIYARSAFRHVNCC